MILMTGDDLTDDDRDTHTQPYKKIFCLGNKKQSFLNTMYTL